MNWKCRRCNAVWEEHELDWRKPFTVTLEDSEPHCPDCDYSGFDMEMDAERISLHLLFQQVAA